MATVQGSFEACKDITGKSLPLQLWKTTVTIAAGATTASIESSNKASGTVVAVWLDPGTLTASATIKGYSQTDDISTPTYFIDYTVPNPAVETRAALNARLRVFGKLEIDIASATAADSVTIYVWVDPNADTGTLTDLDFGTAGTPSADVLTVQGDPDGTPLPVTPAAATPYKNIDVDESEDQVSATACVLAGFYAYNNAASGTKRYLKLYNATAANVTVGTTVPDMTFELDGGQGLIWDVPLTFSTALTVAATTGVADNDSGAPADNDVLFMGAVR